MKQLISKAVLTKESDGRRITVEIRMAEQIKKFYDWWDMFLPEVILVGQNECTSTFWVFNVLQCKECSDRIKI